MGAPILAAALGILILGLTPLEEVLLTVSGRWFPIGALGFACLLFVYSAASTHYSPAHPMPSMMKYALDADTGKALWASSADRTDPWIKQYVGTSPVRENLKGFYAASLPTEFFVHDAPAIPLAPPRVELLKNSATPDSRTLRLHITSPRNARTISVEVPDSPILEGSVDDRKISARWNENGNWAFEFANVSPQGIELNLHAKGTGRIRLVVVDRSVGLPEIPGAALPPRPLESVPQDSGDETLVRRVFVF